jgi:phage terminase small subunit
LAENKLTPKQELFIAEYLIDFNATQAFYRAGYKASTTKSAQTSASKLLANSIIAAEIDKRRKADLSKTENLRNRMIEELINMAFSNGTDYAEIGEDGIVRFTPTSKLPPEKRAAVAGIEQGTTGTKVKMHDKLKAMELLGKMTGQLDTGAGNPGASLADAIRAAYEKRMTKEGDEC